MAESDLAPGFFDCAVVCVLFLEALSLALPAPKSRGEDRWDVEYRTSLDMQCF